MKQDRRISRRFFLKASAGLTAAAALRPLSAWTSPRKTKVIVVGAGAFGGWTALSLLRQGADVTLLDAWGPGNSRASSGGETRVIRAGYGSGAIYTKMAARALQLWNENEERWKRKLYTRTGVLWMVAGSGEYEEATIPVMKKANLPYEPIDRTEAAKRYPQINFDDIHKVFLEPQAGYLLARQACQTVLEGFVSEGGKYKQVSATPGAIHDRRLDSILISGGQNLVADRYVFACGPWLGKLFPEVLEGLIQPSRQEVYYFGTPPGDARFTEENLPVWVHHAERLIYGIPGNQWRGLKIADDTHGPAFDPTSGERVITPEKLNEAREMLERIFPDLKDAPLLESRVCQYENSPDSNFIVDRHPAAENLWFVGGGSGHGFKHGPALGEYTAGVMLQSKPPEPQFLLSRFSDHR